MPPRPGLRRSWALLLLLGLTLVAARPEADSAPARDEPLSPEEERLAQRLDKEHVIHLQDGRFRLTNRADLDRLFEALEKSEKRDRLVIHFHGGLVKREPATGDEPFGHLDPRVLRNDPELRESELREFRRAIETDPVVQREVSAITRRMRAAPAPETAPGLSPERRRRERAAAPGRLSLRVRQEIDRAAPAAPSLRSAVSVRITVGAVKVLRKAFRRFKDGRDHGVYPTIVEEVLRELYLDDLAGDIWRFMKEATENAFLNDAAQYGGTAFLEGLQRLAARDRLPRRILLVGHSAGAIYACNFVQFAAARLPEQVQFELLFLAPAVTYERFAEILRDHPRRIRGVRIFSMEDRLESGDVLVPLVYTRSLLYFISGVLEGDADEPLVGLQRFQTGQRRYHPDDLANIRFVRDRLRAHPDVWIWSQEARGLGRAASAIHHGDFDDADPATLSSLRHIISNGLAP